MNIRMDIRPGYFNVHVRRDMHIPFDPKYHDKSADTPEMAANFPNLPIFNQRYYMMYGGGCGSSQVTPVTNVTRIKLPKKR